MSLPAKPYYRYFKNIKQEVISSVAELSLGLWRLDQIAALDRLNTIGLRLSAIYHIPTILSLELGTREVYYYTGRIELPKISLISFLHEYRHHMQIAGNKQHYRDKEDDARGWSISLFAQALPDMFDRAWQNGRIWYLPPYSANWRQEVDI